MISLKKTSQLTNKELKQIKELHTLCQKLDGYDTHVYWNALMARPNNGFADFLFYVDGELAGYLGFFVFEQDSAEICGLVHPAHRQNKIFSRLFDEAQLEMKLLDLTHCFFVRHPSAKAAKQVYEKLGATYCMTEYKMLCAKITQVPELAKSQKLKLKKATEADFELLAEMSAICFDVNPAEELERIELLKNEKNRGIYLALMGETPVGKVHYVHSDDETVLHDFCVLPVFQGQGITAHFLKKIVRHLFRYKSCPKSLMITSDKPKVIQLYKACGFRHSAMHENWRFNIMPLHQSHATVH